MIGRNNSLRLAHDDTEIDPDTPPGRAPEINRLLDNALLALRLVSSDKKRLQAITTAAKLLHRFGKTGDAIEVQDLITESAIHTYNLDADDVQAAWVKGIDRADHLLKTKALDEPPDPVPQSGYTCSYTMHSMRG
jgi:hypothetical protein